MRANPALTCVVMVLLSTTVALPPVLRAGTPVSDAAPLSLQESIAIALERNLGVRLATRDVQIAASARDQAFAGFLPKLSTLVEYTHRSEAPDLEIPPALSAALGLPPPASITSINLGGRDVSSLKVTLQQPLFTGFSVTNTYRRARVALDMSRHRLAGAQHALAFEVVQAYLAVLRAQKGEELFAQQVRALEAHAAQAQAFFEGGTIPKNDLLKAEVELANARQNLIRAQNRVELARASFNHALGRPLQTPVQLEEVEEVHPLEPPDLAAAIQRAWDQRPELQERQEAVDAARLGVAVAKSQLLPQLSVGGTYTMDLVGGNPNVSAERWEVGGVVQWRPFEGGRLRAQVVEAKIGQERALDALAQGRERVALDVKEAVLNLVEAEQKIRVAERSIAHAEENFRISQERYRAHITTTTEVVDAEALLTQARTNYFNAIYDYQLAALAFKRATGTILE